MGRKVEGCAALVLRMPGRLQKVGSVPLRRMLSARVHQALQAAGHCVVRCQGLSLLGTAVSTREAGRLLSLLAERRGHS